MAVSIDSSRSRASGIQSLYHFVPQFFFRTTPLVTYPSMILLTLCASTSRNLWYLKFEVTYSIDIPKFSSSSYDIYKTPQLEKDFTRNIEAEMMLFSQMQ